MSASTRYSRASSPSRSTATTSSSSQSRINIVQRLVVEVKADKNVDQNGAASVKMFLRISIPAGACAPGAIIPLFPEENLKILQSYIHPLDQNNVPYNFTHHMLRRTARALSLPTRSNEPYLSLFDSVRSSVSPSISTPKIELLEPKYVGDITVNQYQVCYVLPRELPLSTRSYDGSYGRRSGLSQLQFMAAIEVWAPLVAKPPQYPYLLDIPVPRCLNNYLSAKVYPHPNSLSSSAASLASIPNDDWHINCVPELNPTGQKRSLSRRSSYQHFADDESSDSSGSGSDWTCTSGTFPTTESLVIRWSVRSDDVPTTSDNRRRAGFKEVQGEMSCVIINSDTAKGKARGRNGSDDDDEGVLMQLEYTATCKGITHPSSAWLLAFDVQLNAGDCEVAWAPSEKQQWTVSGGKSFCGCWVGPPPPRTPSRRPSMSSEAPSIRIQSSTPNGKAGSSRREEQRWASTSGSLLRAPLPSAEDSLSETSPSIEHTSLSSVNSSVVTTVPSSPEKRSRASSFAPEEEEPGSKIFSPKVPVSVHIDAGRMVPPQTSTFTFTITGTVLVKPPEKSFDLRHSSTGTDAEDEPDPIVLPQFRVVYAEKQVISTIVRNDTTSSALDVYNALGSLSDPQTRKTVVHPRGHTKLGDDGARLAIRTITSPRNRSYQPGRDRSVDMSGRRTPSGPFSRPSSAMSIRSTTPRRSRRTDGKAELAHVMATITPEFANERDAVPTEYEVRLVVEVDEDPEGETEWLAFGLPRPVAVAGKSEDVALPKVDITKVTLDGATAHYETNTVEKPGEKLPALGFPLEEEAHKESMTWVQVHLGDAGSGKVQVEYSVSMPERLGEKFSSKGKGKGVDAAMLDVLLPMFELPVGKMEVRVPEPKGFTITPTRSNFPNKQQFSESSVLIRRNVEELFHPELTITIIPIPPPGQTKSSSPAGLWTILAVIICTIPTSIALLTMSENRVLIAERGEMKDALDALSTSLAAFSTEAPLPLTVTSTHISVSTVTVIPEPETTTQLRPSQAAEPVLSGSASASTSTSTSTSAGTSTSTSTGTFMSKSTSTSTSTSTSIFASDPAPSIPTLMPTVLPEPEPSASPTDAILPIRDLPFLWPIHIDIPPLEIPRTVRATAAVFARGFGFAWQLCRRVFHYPLDPP
ncbi:uncharacterized protein PHACADRAFT_208567 [Phanerochaete carnosa HHB-10118-sp]|uniref:Uncharacterized protein n=1 Tax=Phanerochaete carnosa (strain HHB-10118-sp) TaxID=650164 RepID=K5WX31_PHACS|nr:uncharacterized protein PHACADRAFT_208567 [Phanerochaete carnosa HHB-10118-sp]EKM55037.1 hypothetical protein PHACADRAFT_208567 [Phanerochaete carnosa HHB-10118-sp]